MSGAPNSSAFLKMHGAGNDFIVLDGRVTDWPWTDPEAIARRAARRTGVGCEGVLILLPPEQGSDADVRLVFLNPDGHEAELCGNGTRCAALFAFRRGFVDRTAFRMATGAGTLEVAVLDDNPLAGLVRIRMPRVRHEEPVRLRIDGHDWTFSRVNSGVPHAVAAVEDVDAVDVARIGRAVRWDPAFAPAGTNVDFVQRTGIGSVRMRTYERGVEEESGACGTGAVACVAAMRDVWGLGEEVNVRTSIGGTLTVGIGPGSDATLAGPAVEVYEGFWMS